MTRLTRTACYDLIWSNVDPSISGYSDMIQRLMGAMTETQLRSFVADFESDDEDDEVQS